MKGKLLAKKGTRNKQKRSVGKPLTTSVGAFLRRYVVEKELRKGTIVRDKRTGKLLKVYGDKAGRTVIEPYYQ